MKGCVSDNALLLQTIAESLSSLQIASFIKSAPKVQLNIFSEIALNLVANEDYELLAEDKQKLIPYKKQLYIVVDRKQSVKSRRACFAAKPQLVKNLAQLALKCASE